MTELTQLGVGGIFCIMTLRTVFDFLKANRKRELNGSGPEYRIAESLETIANDARLIRDHAVKQTVLLEQIRKDHEKQAELTAANSRILAAVQDRLRVSLN